MFRKMKNRKGFTLIEMMAVIAIVAVLVAIVVPTIGKAQLKSKASVDAANLRSLSASIATRYVTTTSAAELKEGLENPGSKLVPEKKAYIFVYREGNTVNSYFADNLLGTSANLRGTPYNGYVATYGELPENYDIPADDAELLCIFGAADGSSIAQDIVNELSNNINGILSDAYEALYPEIYNDLRYNEDGSDSDFYKGALSTGKVIYQAVSAGVNLLGVDNLTKMYTSNPTGRLYKNVETAYQSALKQDSSLTRTDFANKYFQDVKDAKNGDEFAANYAEDMLGATAAAGAYGSATDDVVNNLTTSIDKIGEIAGTELDININEFLPTT